MGRGHVMALNRIVASGRYADFLDYVYFIHWHKGYSVFNASLIYIQRPGASYVATDTEWNHRGRSVNPGATPIVIMQPFGPVNFVYEKADTYRRGLSNLTDANEQFEEDEYVIRNDVIVNSAEVGSLVDRLQRLGVYVSGFSSGMRLEGECRWLEDPITYEVYMNQGKKQISSHYCILVKEGLSPHEQFLSILHEMGHLLCGHVGYDKSNKNLKFTSRKGLSEPQSEFEAETVCKLVTDHFDMKNYSDEYLSRYVKEGRIPEFDLQISVEAADKLIRIICGT